MIAATLYLVYLKKRRYFPDYGDVHRFDPSREGGHLLPNLDQLVNGERLGQRVRFITNSKGFRNEEEFTYEVPQGTFRILFLGDSFVDGMRTDHKNTIGFILDEILDSKNRDVIHQNVEVMIAGNNNPTNSWYYIQEHGWKYHPDLIIIGVTLGNDLTSYNYGKGMIPVSGKDGSVILELAPHVRQGFLRNRDLMLPDDAYTGKRNLWEFFEDLDLKMRRRLAYTRLSFKYDVPPIMGPNASFRRHVFACGFYVSLGLYYQPILPEVEKLYSDFEKVMIGIKDQTEKHGSRLLVVIFPIRVQVVESDWELLRKYYSLDPMKFDLTYPNRRISSFFHEVGIHYLDLLPAFKQFARNQKEPLYRPRGDMHFNERAQRLAAEVIAETILKSDWLHDS